MNDIIVPLIGIVICLVVLAVMMFSPATKHEEPTPEPVQPTPVPMNAEDEHMHREFLAYYRAKQSIKDEAERTRREFDKVVADLEDGSR